MVYFIIKNDCFNFLRYLTLLLDDWSDSPEFVRLQFFLQQLQSNGIFF
jgi:hypothetical protein